MSKRHRSTRISPQIIQDVTHASFPLAEIFLVPLTCLLVISFALHTLPTSPLTAAFTQVKQNPWKLEAHLRLANVYITMGDFLTARQEMHLAQTLKDQTRVLGITSDFTNIKDKLEGKEAIKRREFWQSVVKEHPNYRDGWVQLLYLAYNSGYLLEAKSYLEKISALDPIFIDQLTKTLRDL